MEKYISITELQEALGISKSTAYALTKRADFPSVRIGKRVVIPETALQEWLAKGGTEEKGA